MLKLDKDDYDILYELYFNNASIHQLAKKLGVTRPAVRWQRAKAIKQLKKMIFKKSKKLAIIMNRICF